MKKRVQNELFFNNLKCMGENRKTTFKFYKEKNIEIKWEKKFNSREKKFYEKETSICRTIQKKFLEFHFQWKKCKLNEKKKETKDNALNFIFSPFE